MPKIWAEVSLDSLPTINRCGEKDQGERLIRFKTKLKICPFHALNLILSLWVVKKRTLNWYELNYFINTCREKIAEKRFDHNSKRTKLFLSIIKYDLHDFLRSPQSVRKRLIQLNKQETILYSPRSLNSDYWDEKRNFCLYIEIKMGPRKKSFPEPVFIGVGYRDKGHCRKIGIDDSPGWKEIAMDEHFQNNQSKEEKDRVPIIVSQILNPCSKELRRNQLKRSKKERLQYTSLLF